MTISQMECFTETVRYGSISKAGEYLYVSQQNISRQIRALETELGFPVLIRHNKGVTPTEWGKILYEEWSPLLIAYRASIDKARDRYHGAQNTIRLGTTDLGSSMSRLTDRLLAFNEAFPDLDIHYNVLPMSILIQQLREQQIDMIITANSEFDKIRNIKSLRLNRDPIQTGIFISKNHPLASRRKLDVQDLKGEKIAALSESVSLDYVDQTFMLLKMTGTTEDIKVVTYDSRQDMELALVSRKCFTVSYRHMFENLSNKLRFYPLDYLENYTYLSLGWIEERYDVKARNLTEFLRN